MNAHEKLLEWGFEEIIHSDKAEIRYYRIVKGRTFIEASFKNDKIGNVFLNKIYAFNCKTFAQLYSLLYMFDLIKEEIQE